MVDTYEQELAQIQAQQSLISQNRSIAQQQQRQLQQNLQAYDVMLRPRVGQDMNARLQAQKVYGVPLQQASQQQREVRDYLKGLNEPERQLGEYKTQIEKSKEQYDKELAEYNKQISSPEYQQALKQYEDYQREQKEWKIAQGLVDKGFAPFGLSRGIREKYKQLLQNVSAAKSKAKAFTELTALEKEFGVKIKPLPGWEGFEVTNKSGATQSVSGEKLGELLVKSQKELPEALKFNPTNNPYVFTTQISSQATKEKPVNIFEAPQFYIQKGVNWLGNVADIERGVITKVANIQAQKYGIPKEILPVALNILAPKTALISPLKPDNELISTATKLDVASYLVPYVGEARFIGTDIPAFVSKSVRTKGEYIKQNPIESALTIGGVVLMAGSKVLSSISKTAKPGAEIGFVKLSESSQPLEKIKTSMGEVFVPSTKEFTPQGLDFYGYQKVQYKNPFAFLGAKPIEITRPIKITDARIAFAETGKTGLISFEKPFQNLLPEGYEMTRLKVIGTEADTLKDITQIHPKVNQQAFEDVFLKSEKAKQFSRITSEEKAIVGTKTPEYISYLQVTKPLEYKNILGFTKKVAPESLKITTGKALAYDSERMIGYKMGHVGEEITTPFAITFPRKTTTVTPLSIIEKTFPNEFKQYGVRTYDLAKSLEKGKEAKAFPIKYFIKYQEKPYYAEGKGTTKTPLISSLLKSKEEFKVKSQLPPKGEYGNLRKGQFEKLEITPRPSFNEEALVTSSGVAVEELTGAIPGESFNVPNVLPTGASIIRTPQRIIPKSNQIEIPLNRPINKPINLLKPTPISKPISINRPISLPKNIPIIKPIQFPINVPIVTPIVSPIQSPIVTPIVTPIVSPIVTPITTPIISPIITPIITPTQNTQINRLSRLKKESFIRGYKTLIRRRNRWFELPGISPRQEAIQKGEKIALGTLAASFSIKPIQYIEGEERLYEPSPLAFRKYAIRGKQRINLPDTWIQKAGTRKEGITVRGARLSSYGERQEIKGFLKSKVNFGRTNVKRKKSPFF